MVKVTTFIVMMLLLALLFSCSSAQKAHRHLRKAKKHVLKAEALGATWGVDTIFKLVEIPVPEVRTDTVVRLQSDTIKIDREKLSIRVVRIPGTIDSIFVEGVCKADTIYKEVVTTITRTVNAPASKWKTPAIVFAGVCGLLMVLLAILVRRR